MKQLFTILLLALLACGQEDTPGRRAEGQLSFATSMLEPAARAIAVPNGWTVQLDEAVLLLGPVYLRPPKRADMSLFSVLFSRAYAHETHGQTLADGEVMGEYLGQIAYDALGGEVLVGSFVGVVGPLDRLSLILDAPRSPEGAARTHGHQAFVRGKATRGIDQVTFACGLRIEAMADAMPKNLEARRRIDRIAVAAPVPLDEGATLRVRVHPERWFDFVSFDDLIGVQDVCPDASSPFALQWYLGLRRPDSFSAELN
jgi:hypothetical protein